MDGSGGGEWDRILRLARRAVAAHILVGDEIDPPRLAAELLRLNMTTLADDHLLRLEIYIRRELPAIERMVAELERTRGGRG